MFPDGVDFTLDASDPAQGWPGVQPGPLDDWAGREKHPFQVTFELPVIETGSYVLGVVLVNTHNVHPGVLEIEVNGAGRDLGLPAGAGDGALTDPAQGQNVRFDLPLEASLFQSGQNSIRLTTTGSWLIWDSLSLSHLDQGVGAAIVPESFQFEVLPLFKRNEGGLVQPARFSLNLVRAAQNLVARLSIQGRTVEVKLGSELLGRVEKKVDIPGITQAGEARVELFDGSDLVFAKTFAVRPARKWTI